MTPPEHTSPDSETSKTSKTSEFSEVSQPSGPATPRYHDRVYRSPAGIAGGVLLLAVIGWLGADAVVAGEGRTPWLSLATMLLLIPLILAYTLRPAVHANDDRLRVRNPFRVIVLPWGQVASLRSGFSNEVVDASGTTYQLWALPVSLRARKRAARYEARVAAQAARRDSGARGGRGDRGAGPGLGIGPGGVAEAAVRQAETDRAMGELRELHEWGRQAGGAQGEVTVRWAYEIVAPAVAGAVLLGILLAAG